MRTSLLLAAAFALSACGDKPVSEIDNDEDGVFADVDCDDEDASVGEASTWYGDADGDGHAGDNLSTEACAQPAGFFADVTDCDDLDASVSPDGTEICNGVDDDCDGLLDGDDDSVDPNSYVAFFEDIDGDGYGNPDATAEACTPPEGYVADGGDCDDLNTELNPETYWYQDLDRDGFGAPEYFTQSCEQPDGYLADSSDCDDLDEDVNPDATEICNDGTDDDCDGYADDADPEVDLGTASDWYVDADGDGYGDPDSEPILACAGPSGTAADSTDCDDQQSAANPGLEEICGDGIDNDCDGGPNTCGLPTDVIGPDADVVVMGPSTENLGWESTLGDFNGDGQTDLVTASYYHVAVSGSTYGGLTHVKYGPVTGDLSFPSDQDAGFQGDDSSDYSGKTLGSGDFNGDGYDDLLISAYQDDNNGTSSGSVFLYYGSSGGWSGTSGLTESADASWAGAASSDYLGLAVRGLGDLNGDGYEELGMGSDSYDGISSNGGAIFIFPGQSAQYSGLDNDPTDAALIIGGAASDYVGDYRSLSALGDLDGDGYDDFVVGATSSDPNGTSSGGAFVGYGTSLSASLTITTADLDVTIAGEAASDYLGDGVASAGDVDGDGYPDMLVGADGNDDVASSAGKAYLFLGGSSRFPGYLTGADAAASVTGLNSSDYLGEGVIGGDFDGDGYSDIAVGADGFDAQTGSGSVSSAGVVYMFYGPLSGGWSAADADMTMEGADSSGYLGQDLRVGDVDGDGYTDLIAAAYGADYLAIMLGAPGL